MALPLESLKLVRIGISSSSSSSPPSHHSVCTDSPSIHDGLTPPCSRASSLSLSRAQAQTQRTSSPHAVPPHPRVSLRLLVLMPPLSPRSCAPSLHQSHVISLFSSSQAWAQTPRKHGSPSPGIRVLRFSSVRFLDIILA